MWAYTHDRISADYSLLRPDVFAFPFIAWPEMGSIRRAYQNRFTYKVAIKVPVGYTVACGGRLVESTAGEFQTTFVFESGQPADRLDIAAAKFKVITSEDGRIKVYGSPQHIEGAERVSGQRRNLPRSTRGGSANSDLDTDSR